MRLGQVAQAVLPPVMFNALYRAMRGRTAPAVASVAGIDEKFARAQRYGLNRARYDAFMNDADGAEKIAPLFVYGANKQVKFPPEGRWFIIESMFEDAYFLETIANSTDNWKIIDIGANVGAFLIAARHNFPMATIHAYEPNAALESYLKVQGFATRSKIHMVGVGKEHGSFSTDNRQNEILGSESVLMLDFNKPGNIPIIPFREALDAIGGHADLVKLDCEGSEWVITSDPKPFKRVRYIAMEYHRLPLDGSFDEYDLGINIHDFATKRVSELGFDILHRRENSVDAGIVLAKNRCL